VSNFEAIPLQVKSFADSRFLLCVLPSRISLPRLCVCN